MANKIEAGLLVVGRRFYVNGPYGGPAMIVAVYGEPGLVPVGRIGGIVYHGGSATFDVVYDSGRMSCKLPESIIGSGAPYIMSEEVASAEEVAEALAAAAIFKASEAAKAAAAAAAFAAAKEAAKAAGLALGLVPEAEFKGRGCAAAYNLRRELKAAGIKVVSLRSDGYDAIRVKLADAADLPAAKVICGKYEAGHFDGMTDCYDYDPSAWGAVFGDVRYVFEGVDR
jgi:hypothetical protein